MRLKDVCKFSVNNPDADFWLIRKGSADVVGTPTKEFSPEHIGVKVDRTDILVPDFLYYFFEYLVMSGKLKSLSRGTTNLQNITISDIGNIPVSTDEE
jgi:hypothetical protein